MTITFILKGALLGIGVLLLCRSFYLKGYKDGGNFVINLFKAKMNSEEKSDKN